MRRISAAFDLNLICTWLTDNKSCSFKPEVVRAPYRLVSVVESRRRRKTRPSSYRATIFGKISLRWSYQYLKRRWFPQFIQPWIYQQKTSYHKQLSSQQVCDQFFHLFCICLDHWINSFQEMRVSNYRKIKSQGIGLRQKTTGFNQVRGSKTTWTNQLWKIVSPKQTPLKMPTWDIYMK